jgi:hypothetical protein
MNRLARFVRAGWLCIAIALEYASTLGGDASILWGWILLFWTAPFSMVFQFFLYDFALQYMTRPVAQLVGSIFEVVCAYIFWFVIIPKVIANNRGVRLD